MPTCCVKSSQLVFDVPQLRQLVLTAQRHSLRAGEFLFFEGEPGERIFLIRQGQLEIVSKKSSLGRIALRSRGEWIGEMALLESGGLRTASARALEPSLLLSWDRDCFNSFLQRKPQLALSLSRLLSQRLVDMQKMAYQDTGLPRVGHVFGDYLLLEMLGKGGMGSVFRARHLDTDQMVALKIVQELQDRERELHDRFVREGQTLMALDHPNIVRVVAQGTVEGLTFLAMELLEGETLEQRLGRGPLSLPEVSQWFVPVARALHYSHQRHVSHRDIKPDNVMLCKDGVVKIIDFGLAMNEQDARLTATGKNVGTPAYFAPERALHGHRPEMEHYSDQYSLGVTLFRSLTGELPFRGSDPLELLMHHLRTPPPRPSSLRAEIPAALDALILRMLTKEPSLRLPSLDRMEDYLSQRTVVCSAEDYPTESF